MCAVLIRYLIVSVFFAVVTFGQDTMHSIQPAASLSPEINLLKAIYCNIKRGGVKIE